MGMAAASAAGDNWLCFLMAAALFFRFRLGMIATATHGSFLPANIRSPVLKDSQFSQKNELEIAQSFQSTDTNISGSDLPDTST